MDRLPHWHQLEPEEPTDADRAAAPEGVPPPASERLRIALAGLAGMALIGAAGLVIWAGTPQPQVVIGPEGNSETGLLGQAGAATPTPSSTSAAELLIDIQGAVVRPGLQRLPPGSRVGDAIAVAGGYAAQLDVRAAAQRLNLAEPLRDGAKIYVPARGDAPVVPTNTGVPYVGEQQPSGDGGGGLIDLNTASQAQLETLPGIGPVTAGKLIAAREEAPFAAVDDLLSRDVVGPATLEKIRALVTVSP